MAFCVLSSSGTFIRFGGGGGQRRSKEEKKTTKKTRKN